MSRLVHGAEHLGGIGRPKSSIKYRKVQFLFLGEVQPDDAVQPVQDALQFATRRLWSWRAEFGAESHWAAELGRRAAERGADQLWPDLTRAVS